MAELMQLDKAARLVGKSEVTVRRLIKAGKIPFKKEKTLTGFIYLVDPEVVKGYYGGKTFHQVEMSPALEEEVPVSAGAPASGPIRIAVASETGPAYEYWQKKSDMYEEKYNAEVSEHSRTREDLGVWRGRAEQSQAMLMKLLPAAGSNVEVKSSSSPEKKERSGDVSWMTIAVLLIITLLMLAGVGAMLYVRFGPH